MRPMDARQFHARMQAAAKAFRAAGGQHPFVRVSGETIEITERPPNSTNCEEAANNQARIEEGLGVRRSQP